MKLKEFYPIFKDDKIFCPSCKIELVFNKHKILYSTEGKLPLVPFGGRRIGSEGNELICPKCGFTWYEATIYYD